MVDTVYADVSYYQRVVNDSYPYAFFCFRANDGTFRDPHFYQNLSWAKRAVSTGKIEGFLVYTVFEPDWKATFETLKSMVGTPDPAMGIMIDVESWGGRMHGDYSAQLNLFREAVIEWLNSYRPKSLRKAYAARDRKRVVAYANQGDRAMMWPRYRDTKWDIANYSYNPHLEDQIAHQFSSSYPIPPFGPCDVNSADGIAPKDFAKLVGLAGKAPHRARPPKFPLPRGASYGMANPKHAKDYDGRATEKHRAEIKMLQKKLIRHGFAGKVDAEKWCDGIYGEETMHAVNKFKKKMHWRQTGRVGRRAWDTLVRL